MSEGQSDDVPDEAANALHAEFGGLVGALCGAMIDRGLNPNRMLCDLIDIASAVYAHGRPDSARGTPPSPRLLVTIGDRFMRGVAAADAARLAAQPAQGGLQ